MPNEIYEFLKANKLTDKSEGEFLKEYSNREKADEIHEFMVANKLTDKTSDEFYTTYLKKKEPVQSSGQQGGSPLHSSGTKPASVPEKAPPASIARPQAAAPQPSYAETVVGKAVNLGAQPQEPANKPTSKTSGVMGQQAAQSGANAKIVSRPTNPLEAVVQQEEQVKEQVKAATPSLSPEKQYEANQRYNKNVDDQLRAAQYKLDQNRQKGAYAGLNHEMRLKYSPEYRADLQEIERLQALKKEWDAKSKESIDKVKPVIEKDVQAIFKDDAWMKTLVTESGAGSGTTVKKADTNAIMAKAIEMAKAKGLEPDSYYRKLLQNEIEGYVAYKIKEPEYEKVFNEKFVSEFKVMPDQFIKDVAQGYNLEYEKKIGSEKEIAKNKQDAIAKSLDQEYAPVRAQAEATYKQAIDALSQAAQNDPEITAKVDQYQNQVVAKLQADINAGIMTPEDANAYLQGEEFNKEVNGVFQNLVAEKYDKMYDDAYKLYSDEISQVNKKMNQRYVREAKEVLAISQSKINNLIKEYDATMSKLDIPPHIKHAMERIWNDAVSTVNEREGMAQNAKEQGLGAFGAMYRSFVTTLGSNFKNMGYKWGAESLESLGSTMESAYTYQPEEVKDWSDLLDLSKVAKSTGSLGGSMLPTMLPAMTVTFGTMGAGGGAVLAMLTGAATSFLSESEMMAAQVYNDKLIETGSASQAEKAKREMWKGQVDMMWAYTFDMLPFVNVLSKVMPNGAFGKAGQVVAGAVIEPATETIQEYMQQANEMSISKYGDISKADEFKTKERVKKVFLEVAPTGILGGGGQALQLVGEARDQAYVNKRLAELNVSSTIAQALGENGYRQHVFTMMQDMGADKTLLALNTMYQQGMIDKVTLDMGLKAVEIGQQSMADAQAVGIKTGNGQKVYNNYTLEIENLKQAWAAAETQTAKEVIDAKIEEKQKQQKAFAVSGKSDAVTVIMMDGQQFVTDVNGFVEMMQNPEFAQAYKEGEVVSHFNDQLLLNEAREKLSGIDAGIATNIKDFKPVNATAQEVQDVADALMVGGYDKLNQYQKRVFADNRQSILAYTSLPSRFIRMTRGSKGYGAEVSNIANKIFLEGKESLNADEISVYNKERKTIDSAVEQLGKQEAQIAPQQMPSTAPSQPAVQEAEQAPVPVTPAEPIVQRETIADAVGTPVIFRGKKGTVEFMTDGTVEFTDEQGNVQVVPDATGDSDLKSAGIRIAPAVEMQAVDEQTMLIDGNEYTIETDAKGNVTQLTPVNAKLPAYSTEDMLVEAEIARNRVITDEAVNTALDADPVSVETAVAEVGIASGVDMSGLAAILDNNMTPEIDAAMTKLEGGNTLTADERALFDDYILKSVSQLEQAKQNNAAIAPVVDNLINQLYEYDKSIEAAAGKPAVAKPAEAKVEPVVQKPAEGVEAAGQPEAKPQEVEKTNVEPAKQPEISPEKPQVVTKPAEAEKMSEKKPQEAEKEKQDIAHNNLVNLKNSYNKLTDAQKNRKQGQGIMRDINEMSKRLGYTVSLKAGKLSVTGINGKEIAKRNKIETLELPSQQDIDYAIGEIQKGVLFWDGDPFSLRVSLGIPRADITKGEADIKAGRTDTNSAIRLVNALVAQRAEGGYTFMLGSGGTTAYEFYPFAEVEAIELSAKEEQAIEDAQEELAAEYDAWFESLTAEQQDELLNILIEEYGQEEGAGQDTESGEGKDDVSDKEEAGKPKRFEEGRKLTKEQKREVLKSLKDAYWVNQRPYTIEDTESGERKVYLDDAADYMETSDITGRKLRWFIELPDGRIAHPTEVYGNVANSEVVEYAKNIERADARNERNYQNAVKKISEKELAANTLSDAIKNGRISIRDSRDKYNGIIDQRVLFAEQNKFSISISEYLSNIFDRDIIPSDVNDSFVDWNRFIQEFATNQAGKPKAVKPSSEKELAKALQDVFGLTDKKAKASAKVMASAAKGMIAAGVFKDEAEFWDSFPEVRSDASGRITESQAQSGRGVYIGENVAGKFVSFIAALSNPDVSTPHHEGAHWWYDMLTIAAGNGNAKAKTIMDAFMKFADSAEGRRFRQRYSTRGERVEMQELWARSYEKFLYEGKSPKGLEGVFEMISQWFKDIYGMITGREIDIVLSDVMRGVYSYILTGDDIVLNDIAKMSEKDAIEAVGDAANEYSDMVESAQNVAAMMPDASELFQPTIEPIKKRIEQYAQVALHKFPDMTKEKFIATLMKNADAKKGVEFLGEDIVGMIFDAEKASAAPMSIFDAITSARYGEAAGLSTSNRGYIDRALADADTQEYYEELQKLGNVADKMSFTAIEPIAQQIFDKMLESESPEAAFLSFLESSRMNTPSASAELEKGKGEKETELTLYNVRSVAAAQVFHKIVAYYRARGEYATAKQWTDVFAGRGRLAGQFTSAMQAISTPEAIANRMMDEDAAAKESVLEKKTKTNKTVGEVFKEVEDAAKTKPEEAERLLTTGKSVKGAKQHVKRKKKVGRKNIEIKTTSADSEKKKNARESLNKRKLTLKEKLKLGGYLMQEPGTLIDELKGVIGDIIDMGAISREQALETFVKELGSMGVKAGKAQELFNQAWDDKFMKPIEANLTAHLAEKVANLAKPKKSSKKRPTDPIELLANGLMARAADIIPNTSAKGYGKAYEGLAEMIRNRELAQKAWTDALELMKVNVNGNPELTLEQRSEIIAQAEDIASNFLKDPLPKSKVRQAIRDGMKDLGLTIDELITKSLTEQNNTGQTLAQILVEQAGLSASEAVLLADAVMADWNEMFADAKRKQVEQILKSQGIDPDEKAVRKEEKEREAKAKEGKSPLERAKMDLFNAEERLLETEMKLDEAQQNLDRADDELEAAKQSGDRNRINTATRVQADAKMKQHRLNNQFEKDLETAEKAERVLAERQAVADAREAEALERERKREQAELDRETARIEREEEAERKREQREREQAQTAAERKAKEAQRKQEREDEKELLKTLDTDERLAYRKEKAQAQLDDIRDEIQQAATEMQSAVDANDAAQQSGDAKKLAEAQRGLNKARKRIDQLSAREAKILARIENLNDLIAKRRQAAIDSAEAALQRMVAPKAKAATGASLVQKVMNAVSAGVLNRSDLLTAFASAYGLTPLTPAQVSYLQMLTAKLINSRGVEMRARRSRELANFMEAMSRYQLLKAYKFAGDLMYAKMLSGINTVMMNIPVGSMTGLYSEVIPKAMTSPMAYFGFLNAYKQLDSTPFFMPGTGMKTFADAIKTGFNMLEDLGRIEKPYTSRGSYFEFVFQKGAEMLKSDNYVQRVKGAILMALSKFKFFMNFTVAWDAMFNHRYGEMALFIDTWNAEKNAGIKGYANLLEATKKKLGLDDPAVAAAKQEVTQIEAAEIAMGEQLPIGHQERELKWQVMRNRSMEAVEKSYDAIKGAALMGRPTGISGKAFDVWMRLFQYREGNTLSDNAINTFMFMMNNSVNLFLRIGVKSFNRIMMYSPGIGLFTGVFAEYKPVTEVVDGKRKTSWEVRFNDRGTIMSRLLVQAAMTAGAAALFVSMFKYDDDEEEWVLDENRIIDITLSRGAITGNMSAEKLEKGYQSLSVRVRKPNGEWSAWTTAKYAPMFIGVAAVIGGMRDRMNYLKADGTNYGSPSKKGAFSRSLKDVSTALDQLTFNQNMRLITNMREGVFGDSEYKREMFWRDLLKPAKTMLPFGSNFERDVINIGLDMVGVPMKRGTSNENIFLGGHVMFDAFAENAKTDRWGNVIPKTAATESLATRMTVGYYTDKGLENLRQFVGYKLIDEYPNMYVPETWTTRSHARNNDEFKAYNDKYQISEDAMIELDTYIAEKWGSELRAMYPDRKDRIKSAEQATDLMNDSRDRAVRLVKSGTINGIRNMPARRLYEENPALWRKVFPELAKKHKL